MRKVTKEFEFGLMGLKYRITHQGRIVLAGKCPIKCTLRREPQNPYDRNAIAVFVEQGEGSFHEAHIGYVPAGIAKVMGPGLDEGKLEILEAWVLTLDPDSSEAEMTVTVSVEPRKAKKQAA